MERAVSTFKIDAVHKDLSCQNVDDFFCVLPREFFNHGPNLDVVTDADYIP
jgi:hypothetical protein